MCGRYRLSRRKQLIAEYFETDDDVDCEPRYKIAPRNLSQPFVKIHPSHSVDSRWLAGAWFRHGPRTPASDSRRSMPVRKRSRVSPPFEMPS